MSVLNRLELLDLGNEYKIQIFNEFVVDLNLVYPASGEKVFRNVLENWSLTRHFKHHAVARAGLRGFNERVIYQRNSKLRDCVIP